MKYNKKISIKWKIFSYLFVFVVLLLLILWLFQTVYLDYFYKVIKEHEIKDAMEDIESLISEEDLDEVVQSISEKYDVCILITDENSNQLYSNHLSGDCIIHKMSPFTLEEYYLTAIAAGGKLEIRLEESFINGFDDDKPSHYEKFETFPNLAVNNTKSVLLVNIQTSYTGEEYVIYLNSTITPVDATVKTLRIQLIYISVILIALSMIIALLISKRVSKSIIRINKSAKELAKGNFDINFDGRDYKEISELSDTLNYTALELGKTEKLQKELIANISHDLRTPLTMITGYAEVMRDLPNESTPENIQVIIDEAKRLSILVNDLLDISKLQSGVSDLRITKYDLTESIKSVIARYKKLISQEKYKVEFEYDENIFVRADEYKIYQVIYNFINNAINYSGEDKTVKVRQRVIGDIVRVEVIDYGEGICEKDLENVWDRYYKSNKEHKRGVIGTGLGLSIVKNIMELHGFKYGVESEQGKGSTFWFEIELSKE